MLVFFTMGFVDLVGIVRNFSAVPSRKAVLQTM